MTTRLWSNCSRRFERAGDRAFVESAIVDRVIESRCAAIEEQLFYPAVRATVPDADDLGIEGLEEHHVVKWVLSELDGMSPEDERFGEGHRPRQQRAPSRRCGGR